MILPSSTKGNSVTDYGSSPRGIHINGISTRNWNTCTLHTINLESTVYTAKWDTCTMNQIKTPAYVNQDRSNPQQTTVFVDIKKATPNLEHLTTHPSDDYLHHNTIKPRYQHMHEKIS